MSKYPVFRFFFFITGLIEQCNEGQEGRKQELLFKFTRLSQLGFVFPCWDLNDFPARLDFNRVSSNPTTLDSSVATSRILVPVNTSASFSSVPVSPW